MQGTIELDGECTLIMGCYDDNGRLFFVGPRLDPGSRVWVGAVLIRCELYSEHKVKVDWEKKTFKHYRFSICRATEHGIEEIVSGIDFPKKCQKAALQLFEKFVSAHRAELLAAVPAQYRHCTAEGLELISWNPRVALSRAASPFPCSWAELAVASLPVLDKERFDMLRGFLRALRYSHRDPKQIPPKEARAEIENILLFDVVRNGKASPLADSLWRAINTICEAAEAENG